MPAVAPWDVRACPDESLRSGGPESDAVRSEHPSGVRILGFQGRVRDWHHLPQDDGGLEFLDMLYGMPDGSGLIGDGFGSSFSDADWDRTNDAAA